MKRYFRLISCAAAVAAAAFSVQSCMESEDFDSSLVFPNAIVTVKPVDGTPSFYMQLDDSTTLEASNLSSSPFGEEEVRALVNYTETNEESTYYDKKVYVNWIRSVLTKNMVEDLGAENDTKYGNDPVELAASWVNIVEDGYLTLQFLARWGNSGKAHEVNLLNAGTEDDPYIVEFRHNAHGDMGSSFASGIAAFRLDGLEDGLGLPDTHGETVDLTLRYKSFDGVKTVKFKYCTRKSTQEGNIDTQADFALRLK